MFSVPQSKKINKTLMEVNAIIHLIFNFYVIEDNDNIYFTSLNSRLIRAKKDVLMQFKSMKLKLKILWLHLENHNPVTAWKKKSQCRSSIKTSTLKKKMLEIENYKKLHYFHREMHWKLKTENFSIKSEQFYKKINNKWKSLLYYVGRLL